MDKYVYLSPSIFMELFEEELELYNSKIKLLNWLYEELKMYPEMKDLLNEKGQKLPLNL